MNTDKINLLFIEGVKVSDSFPKMQGAYNKWMSYGTPYDFFSVMHSPADAYSKNGKPTMTPTVQYVSFLLCFNLVVSFRTFSCMSQSELRVWLDLRLTIKQFTTDQSLQLFRLENQSHHDKTDQSAGPRLEAYINTIIWRTLFTWLWRWLPLRQRKRQSPTTVFLKTSLTGRSH